MSPLISDLCYSTNRLVQDAQEPASSLYRAIQLRNRNVQNEKEAIGYLGDFLTKKSQSQKSHHFRASFNHGNDLDFLKAQAQSLKQTYLTNHSSEKATNIFLRIIYYFKRKRCESVAANVVRCIDSLMTRNRQSPLNVNRDNAQLPVWVPQRGLKENLQVQIVLASNDALISKPDEKDKVIGLNPDDLRELNPDYNPDQPCFAKLGPCIFSVKPLNGLHQGSVALTDSQLCELQKATESNFSTNRPQLLTLVKPSQKNMALRTVVYITFDNNFLPFESRKVVKKIIRNQLVNQKFVKVNQTIDNIPLNDLLSRGLSFRVAKIEGSNGVEHSAFISDQTKIKIVVDRREPIVFEDKIIKDFKEATFTFYVRCFGKEELRFVKESDLLKFKNHLEFKNFSGCLYLGYKAEVAVHKDMFEVRLASARVDGRIYEAPSTGCDTRGFEFSENVKVRFIPDSPRLFITEDLKVSKSSDSSSEEVAPVPSQESPPVTRMGLMAFLKQEGVVGLPDRLEETISPIVGQFGPLAPLMNKRGLNAEKGILLYGPSGTGKTSFAVKLSEYLGLPKNRVKIISATKLIAAKVGDTEENIRDLFKEARESKGDEKYLLIIDEIDSILLSRDKSNNSWEITQVNQFLTEMDGPNRLKNILVIGMTNKFALLDPAALRTDRFGVHIEIGIPTKDQRKDIFDVYMKKLIESKALAADVDQQRLIELTDNFTGADIKGLVQSANIRGFARIAKLVDKTKMSPEEAEASPEAKLAMDDFTTTIDTMKKSKSQNSSK